jgi:hypothetical protein
MANTKVKIVNIAFFICYLLVPRKDGREQAMPVPYKTPAVGGRHCLPPETLSRGKIFNFSIKKMVSIQILINRDVLDDFITR